MELETNLPHINHQHIEIRSLDLSPYKINREKLLIECTRKSDRGDEWDFLVPHEMYLIDHPVWGSYIPSKVIPHGEHLYFLYYVNPDLDGVRPFSDGKCYAWVQEWSPNVELRYPAEARLFIDQVIAPNGKISTVFITSTDEFAKLRHERPVRAIELEGDLSMYRD